MSIVSLTRGCFKCGQVETFDESNSWLPTLGDVAVKYYSRGFDKRHANCAQTEAGTALRVAVEQEAARVRREQRAARRAAQQAARGER